MTPCCFPCAPSDSANPDLAKATAQPHQKTTPIANSLPPTTSFAKISVKNSGPDEVRRLWKDSNRLFGLSFYNCCFLFVVDHPATPTVSARLSQRLWLCISSDYLWAHSLYFWDSFCVNIEATDGRIVADGTGDPATLDFFSLIASDAYRRGS